MYILHTYSTGCLLCWSSAEFSFLFSFFSEFSYITPTPSFLILGMLLFFKISKWHLLLCLWKCWLLPHQANSTFFCIVRTTPRSQSFPLGLTSLYRLPHGSFVIQYFLTSVILVLEVGQGLSSNSLQSKNECSECLTLPSPHPKD